MYRDTGLVLGFHTAMMQDAAHRRLMAEMVEFSESFLQYAPVMESRDDVRPNVIVIMSESFADPTTFGDINFSTNPVSNFHRLAQTSISGNVIVPVFGGGTSNTELEFLSGTPMFMMGGGYYIPYASPWRYFSENLYTAMPWLFRDNGYRTVTIHPNYVGFYNRDRVLPRLGFETLIFREDMPNAPIKGRYISDEYFTDRIIEQIIYAEELGEPLFLFGISMQNHWEFFEDKYDDFPTDITATSSLGAAETGIFNTYLQGIFDADRELGRLIEFIDSRDTPTIVVFFGDHLPILGGHDDVIYYDLGFVSTPHSWDWSLQDRANKFSTPYLVWDNMGLAGDDWGDLSVYFLAANVLRHSGIAINRYWQEVLYLSTYFRALTDNHFLDIYGQFHNLGYVWYRPYVRAYAGLTYSNWFIRN